LEGVEDRETDGKRRSEGDLAPKEEDRPFRLGTCHGSLLLVG